MHEPTAARLEPLPCRALVLIDEAMVPLVTPRRRRTKIRLVHQNTNSGAISHAPKRCGRPPRMRQAQALLREQLTGGPKPGAEIEAAAAAAAIPERSLIRAADALDVRTQRGRWWLPGT